MSEQPNRYSPESIALLLERLSPFDLTKGEIFMILNMRPTSPSAFNPIIDGWEKTRFQRKEDQLALIEIVGEVLGKFPGPPDGVAAEDEPGEQGD